VTNLAAAFEGASQGLDELASHAGQQEMAEAQATRAENLAYLKSRWTMQRQLTVEGARKQALIDVTDHRNTGEHAARDEEIDRQESGRAQNQAAFQRQQLINTEQAQDNSFTNRTELHARSQGHAGRAQDRRTAMGQIIKARAAKSQINAWLANYQQQKGYTKAQLLNTAKYDQVLRAKFTALSSADALEQSARGMLDQRPDLESPYGASGPSMNPAPSSSLAPPPTEGPGISDQPYPTPSGDDQNGPSDEDMQEAEDPNDDGTGGA
jgi:hypothetical protein